MSHAFWRSSLCGTSTVVFMVFVLFIFMMSFMSSLHSSVDNYHMDVASGSSMLAITHSGVRVGTNFSYWAIYLLMFVFGVVVVKTKF